jgi:SAM-dependent methyltransferase
MTTGETFQISLAAAEAYEAGFVPALFAEWAPLLLDAARVGPGQVVLDVACGTGIVARTAADRMQDEGGIVGLDLNEAMLTVARRVRPDLAWQRGDVTDLPFQDGSFDVVLCQMALMFFPDKVAALREMRRVCTDRGTVGLVVPAALEDQPAYRAFVDVAVAEAGPAARAGLLSYWSCGRVSDLVGWCAQAGLGRLELRSHSGTARFHSSDDLVRTEVNGSPLAGLIDPDTYERIRIGTARALTPFATADGRFEPPLVGHILTARATS